MFHVMVCTASDGQMYLTLAVDVTPNPALPPRPSTASQPWPPSPGLQDSARQGPVQVPLCKWISDYLHVQQSNMLI